MEWLWLVAILLMLIGLAGIILPVLPGVPLFYGGLLLAAWIDDFTRVSVTTIIIIGVLALLAWLVDFVSSLITTKSVGASKQALLGTVIGGLVGIVGGLLGIIVGTVVGAVVGEIMASRNMAHAGRVGFAAGMGFALALAVKLAFAVLMLGIFAYAYFY